MPSVLSVTNLTKQYGKKNPFLAVDRISFDLAAGQILGFLGPNGSGKTTTIQMLLGTLSITSGSITYFGKPFAKNRSSILQQVSFASTYTSLPFLLTVEENLNYFGLLYGIANSKTLTDPLLERFGIIDKKKVKVSSLSAGQITRLMLVKAFFIQPKIVLLDEPTASLDPDIANDVCRFLLEQREKTGLSILFTSHKMEEVTALCDRVIVLKQGKIIADDLPKNLARSTSSHTLRLTIIDGVEKIEKLANNWNLPCQIDHHTFTCSLPETDIPSFLHQLMQAKISYGTIQIKEPTLDDYFLHIAGKNNE